MKGNIYLLAETECNTRGGGGYGLCSSRRKRVFQLTKTLINRFLIYESNVTDMQTLNTLKCSHKSISKKHPGYQHCASKPHLENEERERSRDL